MKKNVLILALALLIALPVFGLAAEAATAPAEETQTVTPYGGQYGRRFNQAPALETEEQADPVTPYGRQSVRRWNQAPAQTAPSVPYGKGFSRWNQGPALAMPQYRFTDENKDGVCDLCGNEQGKNTQAPGFTDEDKDGVCDYLGTDQQRQGRGQMQSMRGGRGHKGMQPGQQNFGGGRHRR